MTDGEIYEHFASFCIYIVTTATSAAAPATTITMFLLPNCRENFQPRKSVFFSYERVKWGLHVR